MNCLLFQSYIPIVTVVHYLIPNTTLYLTSLDIVVWYRRSSSVNSSNDNLTPTHYSGCIAASHKYLGLAYLEQL